MPLPDFIGRKEIFKIYLKKLPISKDVKIDELAKMTERFSGAIPGALRQCCAGNHTEAATQHQVLEITQADLVNFIKATKPSTTCSSLRTTTDSRWTLREKEAWDGES